MGSFATLGTQDQPHANHLPLVFPPTPNPNPSIMNPQKQSPREPRATSESVLSRGHVVHCAFGNCPEHNQMVIPSYRQGRESLGRVAK